MEAFEVLLLKNRPCLDMSGNEVKMSECRIAEERPVAIYINGRHHATAMISPSLEREFVAGHLLAEGIIKSISELESLELVDSTAKAIIRNPIRALRSRRTIVSGCGGSSSFLDPSKLPKVDSGKKADTLSIVDAVSRVLSSEAHALSGGLHSSGLFWEDGGSIIAEDIGRHNALDKAIGIGFLSSKALCDSIAACTGRISSEMVLKAANAGIPIIASRGATTGLSIEIAEQAGICIVGFVRGERMKVYSRVDRILQSRC
jgi:FdhD protein